MLEQLRLYSQAGEHFPFYNSFPRCTVILKHIKQNTQPSTMLVGSFHKSKFIGQHVCLKKSPSAFTASFQSVSSCIKRVRLSFRQSVYLEMTLPLFGTVSTSSDIKWDLIYFFPFISNFCSWEIC